MQEPDEGVRQGVLSKVRGKAAALNLGNTPLPSSLGKRIVISVIA